jgi:hypothetical protein
MRDGSGSRKRKLISELILGNLNPVRFLSFVNALTSAVNVITNEKQISKN